MKRMSVTAVLEVPSDWDARRCREYVTQQLLSTDTEKYSLSAAETDEILPIRCFHCDEVFRNRAAAYDHFGPDDRDGEKLIPACVDPLRRDEKERLKALRDAEDEIARLQNLLNLAEENEEKIAAFRIDLEKLFGMFVGVAGSMGSYLLKLKAVKKALDGLELGE